MPRRNELTTAFQDNQVVGSEMFNQALKEEPHGGINSFDNGRQNNYMAAV